MSSDLKVAQIAARVSQKGSDVNHGFAALEITISAKRHSDSRPGVSQLESIRTAEHQRE
jgi:hypothetical protein